jgi:RimJ/RimL family protein N-acetyltransferase
MELRDITMDDLPMYEAALTDPRMMGELGGPIPREGLKEKLQGIVDEVNAGEVWFDVIAVEGEAAGWVCIWLNERDGERFNEIGWMVLPEFQGCGLASEAVRTYLERDRRERRWGEIRAYPGVNNGPSNAICRKTGFRLVGQRDVEYMGRRNMSNDWRYSAPRST